MITVKCFKLSFSLQTHNVQLKGEVARYKRKFRDKEIEGNKLRKDLDDMKVAEIKALQVQIKYYKHCYSKQTVVRHRPYWEITTSHIHKICIMYNDSNVL